MQWIYLLLFMTMVGVLSCTPPTITSLNFVASSSQYGPYRDVVVAGNYAYATSYRGLEILDVSNPTHPQWVSAYDIHHTHDVRGIAVDGSYAYIAEKEAGLVVISVKEPSHAKWVGNYDTSGRALGVALSGSYAYVADGSAGLVVIDVSNPTQPRYVGGCDTPGDAVNVVLSSSYAYVADGSAGLQVIDISDTTNPQCVGGYRTLEYARDVALSGSYAYVADRLAGLVVIDVSDPTNPQRVGGYHTPGRACGIALSETYAYVIWLPLWLPMNHGRAKKKPWSGGLEVIDVRSPANPKWVVGYDTSGYVRSVAVQTTETDTYIFVAENYGLTILHHTGNACP